ncbi:acyl carrier protein [Aestuariispira insulae]|uniref:Acyl carrier protein n=1 Tax=Aestuariispira insulae TaxID=1461337 RepID=A0A3D9H2K9_9PROT|nr:acyl carrier protein [Aestuariispira insulae]RED43712.1 acyl carrier protein [Aestuariispira insulae]
MTVTFSRETIQQWLTEQMSELLDKQPSEIDPDRALEEMEALSLDVVHVVAGAMKEFSIKVPRSEFAGHNTINKLSDLLVSHQAG